MPDGSDSSSGISDLTLEAHNSVARIGRATWDRLANPDGRPFHPFVSFDFLDALERSMSVAPNAGWGPHHLTLSSNDEIVGVMPLYVKGHSQGEYVFDHAWADAYERAGGQYYPKLLSAIPFTPATGPRLLAKNEDAQSALASAAQQWAAQTGLSSLHVNFLTPGETTLLKSAGYLIRVGQQFHFSDEGYGDWQGFLGALSSRKRKALRKERDAITTNGLKIDWISGADITEALLDQFWIFYLDTGARKWGQPYLTRSFFSMIAQSMAEHLLFIVARQDGAIIAGAMNVIGGDTLYGRYWGCTKYIPFLHFELCYYQAVDFALAHGLQRVEAGAQGEHKIARGYTPVPTYSAHWIANPSFSDAVARYLDAEAKDNSDAINYLSRFTPFKKEV